MVRLERIMFVRRSLEIRHDVANNMQGSPSAFGGLHNADEGRCNVARVNDFSSTTMPDPREEPRAANFARGVSCGLWRSQS